MSTSEAKLKSGESPFSAKMQGWWVERYVLFRYLGRISIDTDKKSSEMSILAPNPKAPAGLFIKRRSPHFFQHPDFKDLGGLEMKYRDPTISKRERKALQVKLWPLVDRLIREGRITGDLGAPTAESIKIEELAAKVEEMERILNTLGFDFKVLHGEAKRRGWAI